MTPPPPVLPRVALGEPAAVRECIERYGGLVWSLSRRFSSSPTDAEDAVQEVFLDLWKSAGRFDPAAGSEPTFVALIARRRLIDRRRRQKRAPQTEILTEALPNEGMLPVELGAEAALATRALAQLRPEQRQVLLLITCHGLSHEEVAQHLGMPLGTVKAHARRGLMVVRETLNANPGEPTGDTVRMEVGA
jgi:RNA polymerase sigma-70 factor (ECF subfamily)